MLWGQGTGTGPDGGAIPFYSPLEETMSSTRSDPGSQPHHDQAESRLAIAVLYCLFNIPSVLVPGPRPARRARRSAILVSAASLASSAWSPWSWPGVATALRCG